MNTGQINLKLAADLSNKWGPPLNAFVFWAQSSYCSPYLSFKYLDSEGMNMKMNIATRHKGIMKDQMLQVSRVQPVTHRASPK